MCVAGTEARMFGWFRGKSEEERMAEEVADPSEEYVERAKAEIAEAEAMSEDEFEAARNKIERDFVRKLVRNLSRLNRDVSIRLLTGYYAVRDPETPWAAKAGFAGVLLYFLNPFDLIPDMTPVIGYLDDAGVMAAAWTYLSGHVTDAHRAQAEEFLSKA